MIRQPEFVDEQIFEWAKGELKKKKLEIDFSKTKLVTWAEGLCCQIMHVGPYDAEAASIERMEAYMQEQGYETDINTDRKHHEIYLGDPRKTRPDRLRTILRHPVRKK